MSLSMRLVLLLYFVHIANAATIDNVKSLLRDLFQNYSKEFRPVLDQTKPLNVSMSLHLISITDFDAVAEVISLMVVLQMSWNDASLVWNPAMYDNASMVTFSQTHLWLPTMSLANSADTFAPISNTHFKVTVLWNGQVVWSPGGILKAKCRLDVSKFPFDQQTCTLHMTAWGYRNAQIIPSVPFHEILLSNLATNSEWDVIGSGAYVHSSSAIQAASFSITIKRRHQNFLINVFLPMMMLAFVNPFVFILPFNCGERIGYSLTVLLAFTMYMTVVSDRMPASSDPMSYLSYYLLSLLGISSLIVTMNIFQIKTYGKEDSKDPIPKCVGRPLVCLVKFCQRGRVDRKRMSTTKRGYRRQVSGKVCTEVVMNISTADVQSETRQEDAGDSVQFETKMTWTSLAKTVDTIYFIVFQFVTMIATIMWIGAVHA